MTTRGYWTATLIAVISFGAFGPACGDSGTSTNDTDGQATDGGPDDGGADDVSTADASPTGPLMGMLQFHVEHNMEDDTCVNLGTCFLSIEEENDIAEWLSEIRSRTDLAVLHWDRPIPWLIFDQDVPSGDDPVTFYDPQLDAVLRGWLDGFMDHFAQMGTRYLAVTPLHGDRSSVAAFRIGPGLEAPTTAACPEVSPGTVIQFTYDPGTGPVQASFDLERAFANFVRYLYEKMHHPEYLALMIETNMFGGFCPAQWNGLVQLYRSLYDVFRAEVDGSTQVFATVAYSLLLDYDLEQCFGQLLLGPCSQDPPPANYPQPQESVCYPLDLTAINDLDQGDRLEILALSFYPDALNMAVPGADDTVLRAYGETWDGTSPCDLHGYIPPFLDPIAQLDRFGWNKPIAIAETGARSCRTVAWLEDPNGPDIIVEPPATAVTQAFWLDHMLTRAREHNFEFVVNAFNRDYPPFGLFLVWHSVWPPWTFTVFNTFPCMGIYQADGSPKTLVTDVWLDALSH